MTSTKNKNVFANLTNKKNAGIHWLLTIGLLLLLAASFAVLHSSSVLQTNLTSSGEVNTNWKELRLIRGVQFGSAGASFPNYGLSSGVKVSTINNQPVLITDELKCTDSASSCTDTLCTCSSNKGNEAGARVFSLNDPMHPTRQSSLSWDINTSDDTYGDFGPELRLKAVTYSTDGNYSVVTSSQVLNFANTVPWNKKLLLGSTRYSSDSSYLSGIAQVDGSYLLITQEGLSNLTNYTSRGWTAGLDGKTRDLSNWAQTQDLPANAPKMGKGPKVLFGDTTVVSLENTDSIPKQASLMMQPKLVLYNLRQSMPVATVDLSSIFANYFGPSASLSSLEIGDDRWVFVRILKSSDTGATAENYQTLLYIYRVTDTDLQNTAPGLVLDPGLVQALVGVKVGQEPAVITFHRISTPLTANGYNDPQNTETHVYLLQDLENDRVRDILPPEPRLGAVESAAAFIQGNTSYVYIVAGSVSDKRLYVRKFGDDIGTDLSSQDRLLEENSSKENANLNASGRVEYLGPPEKQPVNGNTNSADLSFTTTSEPSCTRRGDMNCDDHINIIDLLFAIQQVTGSETVPSSPNLHLENGDVSKCNANTRNKNDINLLDITLYTSALANNTDLPACID